MSDRPVLVPETPTHSAQDFSPDCPFCIIAQTYGPTSPLSAEHNSDLDPEKLDPPSFVLFSNEHVVAFLDIMPLTRGHVLVAPRRHRVKVGHLSPDESAEIGRVLPLIARSVTRAVMPDIPHDEADYNIVQNNGPGAAQVVPHVHFHIVPRPPPGYVQPRSSTSTSLRKQYPPNTQPTGYKRTMILFGRGMRSDLDDEEAAALVEDMRRCIREDWTSTFGEDAASNASKRGAWKV
ncbi:hit-like protein [Exophiala viscosa]|uniref:Hit-like protein n=1 Tax=Exophiala viscosa TaxID=2486360 RepID=A0AAN6IH30_9EURO|nr:hit-like protein [Exophiala viscosa]KAI1629618.1 hit-like protein [Exophiala viscosa]